MTSSYNRQTQELLRILDQNRDGQLRSREVAEHELGDQFARLDANQDRALDRNEVTTWCRKLRSGDVSLGGLLELAARTLVLLPGETRLVGWAEEEIPGVSVRPAASQELRRSLFIVHLVPGRLPEPRSDTRLASDVLIVEPANKVEEAVVPLP